MITDTKRFKSIKKMLKIMIVIIIFSFTFILLYSNLLNEVKKSQEQAIQQIREEKFDQIFLYIKELTDKSNKKTSNIANSIEEDIKATFDMDELKTQLDSGEHVKELHNLFKRHIKGQYLNNINNSRNGIFILSNNLIEEDLNYERASNPDHNTKYSDNKQISYNKKLFDDALYKIKNHSKDIICMENTPSDVEDHIMLSRVTYDSLKKVYLKEGLEGLRNYQIMVPVYITNTGDIFGQDDIVEDKVQNNHKFIIIQEFNIYDQLTTNYYWLVNDDAETIIQVQNEPVITQLYILGIIYIISIIIIFIYCAQTYNNFIYGYMKAVRLSEDIEDGDKHKYK